MEGLQLGHIGPLSASETAQQGRVRLEAPPKHQGHVGSGRHIRRGQQVAVIAQRQAGVRLRPGKGVPVDSPLVKLRAHPGMNNKQGDGIVVQQGQQSGPLVGIIPADACLDGNFQVRKGIEYAVQKCSQDVLFPQQASPLIFRRYRAGGAAQVQIHLAVAPALALFSRPNEVFRPIGKDLRHHKKVPVMLRVDLLQLLGLKLEIGIGREKGRVVAVRAAEQLRLHLPPAPAGEALHGRGVIFLHGLSLLWAILPYLQASCNSPPGVVKSRLESEAVL